VVTRCRIWRGQPRRRDLTDCQHRIPEPDFRRNINSRFAKDLDAYQDVLAVKPVQGNDWRGAGPTLLRVEVNDR
jgi:hypothetical protein